MPVSPADAAVLRGAAVPTVLASLVVWVVAAVVAGVPGLVGGVLGTVLVLLFCGVGLAVLLRVRQRHAYALMNAALATYLVKIIVLGALLVALKGTTAFSTKAFGWSILVGVLVWTFAEVRAFGRQQILYVDPSLTEVPPSDRPQTVDVPPREAP